MAHLSASRAPNANALHALVIGINNYPFSNLPTLRFAISDADAFSRYLMEDLRVPAQHIINLRGDNATRVNILNALQFLRLDVNIRYGDAIVIYYAGHGATVPPSNIGEGGMIQMILPSDFGSFVYGILDRTIGTLLENVARTKGDNITVVFDCCFSGSGTRGDNLEEQTRGVSITLPVPPGLDEEILAGSNRRGTAIPHRFLHNGLRSHVLLAACNSEERAREAFGAGYFTRGLLSTLKSMRTNRITYTELMDHIPKLPRQNPQCEGYNRNRILFNAEMISNSFFHKINRTPKGEYEINVGEAYGITPRSLFVLYPSRQDTDRGPPLQRHIKPLRIDASKTLLDLPTNMAGMIPDDAVVLQVRVGVEKPFPIYIFPRSRATLNNIVDEVRVEMGRHGTREIEVVSNERLAKLGLDLDTNQPGLGVALHILDPSISQWGLDKMHFPIPPLFNALFRVLSAAAHFDWHLYRESRGIGTSQVDIEFMRLRRLSETDFDPYGPNMIETAYGGGSTRVVSIDVSEKAFYGIKLTNKISIPIYVSVFYFDSSDLSIASLLESPVSTSQSIAEAPLKPQQTLTIGYGSSGFPTFECFLRDGQKLDVGTLKFYFSTEAVDLSYVRQASFGELVRAGGLVDDIPRAHYGSSGQVRRAVWGTVEVRVIQKDRILRRNSNALIAPI